MDTTIEKTAAADTGHGISFGEAFRVWLRVACLSFGGPAGQIALMHKELVERRRWIDEDRFLHALSYCTLLPGPEAQQLATYIGWLMHKTPGGLVAGLLFILPGFVTILALSMLYAGFQSLPAVSALFFGLKSAVLAVVFVFVAIGFYRQVGFGDYADCMTRAGQNQNAQSTCVQDFRSRMEKEFGIKVDG